MAKQGNIGVTSENIFPIIKKFLYSDHEIFLRELVSNAVDATQKLKTLASVGEFKGELGDLTVQVSFDDKIIKISDRGIGMTAEEIDKYINQIAFSGAEEFVEKYINFFSIGLSNILLTFDINNIIISGNLAKYIEKYQQDILKNIQKNIFFKNYPLNILCSNLNERSSILGAALIPISDFFNLVNSD